jgi:hypothetical protein
LSRLWISYLGALHLRILFYTIKNQKTMKSKQTLFAVVFFMFLSISGFSAVTDPALTGEVSKEATSIRVAELETRLHEIEAMDIKSMSRTERRTLRKEVRAIEKEMKTMANNGVYISVGALIIIILLLILIL